MRLLAILVAALSIVTPAAAQRVTLTGAESDSTVMRLADILERGSYLLVDRDTTLAATARVDRDIIVVRSRLSLGGVVEGSIAVVSGEVFVRPGARVTGELIEVGGAIYPSARAEAGPVVRLDPDLDVDVEPDASGYRVTVTRPNGTPILRIPGFYGIRLPTYDRVSGLTLGWGAELGFGGDTATVSILAHGEYALRGERPGGSIELRLRPSPRSYLAFSASRGSRTPDWWIRDDLANSASAFFVRSDVRNYFESEELMVTVGGAPPPPLIQGEGFVAPRIGLRASRDRSLFVVDPWTLFSRDDPWRANPRIDDGKLASVFAAADAGWRGVSTSFGGTAQVEWSPSGFGEFPFSQLSAHLRWGMLAFPGQLMEVRTHLLLPITGTPPRQRWSFVGGPSTLPTFETGAMRGDHLVLVRSGYVIQFRGVTLPMVGHPALRLEHAIGTAWTSAEDRPPFEQNIGVGLQVLMASAMFYFDPVERPRRGNFSFSIQLPLGAGSRF